MALAPINLASIAAGTGGFVIYGQGIQDESGYSVAGAGDINGDGFDDLIIGAFLADAAGDAKYRAGESYVVFGKAGAFGPGINLASIAAGTGGFVVYGRDTLDYSGSSVAPAGDINGDGIADLIIGAYHGAAANNSKKQAGESYVIFGKAGAFGASIDLTNIAAGIGGFVVYGREADDVSGHSVASAGDINGDGFDDFIIGAYRGNEGSGESYVVFGKARGFGASIDLTSIAAGTGGFVVYGRDAYDFSGWSVASAGDINGDGFDDLIIGSPRGDAADNAKNGAGESYVIFGKARGFGASIDLTSIAAGTGGFVIYGRDWDQHFGHSVASAGDINGDGFDDFIIGEYDGSVVGKSYVVFGKARGFGPGIDLTSIAAGTGGFVIYGQITGDYAGWSVASAGDINGDGFDDIIIGTRSAGKSYVIFGKAGLYGASVDLTSIAAGTGGFVIYGPDRYHYSGHSVSSAGDINGDGFDDLIIGAYAANSAAGESYVLFGRNFTNAVMQVGKSTADTLIGTTRGDYIVGGHGSDVLIGNGGADVLVGGSGNDTIHVSDLKFRRVVGGTGTDTLALDGSGLELDLRSIANSKLQGIERIALTGSGNNRVTLTPLEVLRLSDTRNTVRIEGNVGDSVLLSGNAWSKGLQSGDYTIYTSGQARVEIYSGVTVVGSVYPSPTLSINALSTNKNEGNSGSTPFTFKVIRTGDISKAVTVKWAVTVGPDPAANKSDFVGSKLPFGTVTLAAGDPGNSVITVDVQGDRNIESTALPETFAVTLSNPTGGATIDPLHASANGTIHDDDLVPLLAQLSSLAYEPVFPTGLIPGFRPLTHSDLPSIPLIATNGPSLGRGVYGNANAAALVGITKDALFVAFRGTDTDINGVIDPLDKADWFSMTGHFLRFTDLISATDAYVAAHPNIKTIYVTGHSMGASMAQAYMSQAQHSSLMYRSVTFANPGYQMPGESISDQRITNIHIQGDVVDWVRALKLKAYQERGSNVTFYDSNKATSASAVQLHDIGVYQAAVAGASNIGYSLLASGGKNILGDIVYDIQTDPNHPSWRFLHSTGGIAGTKGADRVIAGSGNDTLVGSEGDDIFTGGAGNDMFSFKAGFGKDVITDFIPGLDRIKFAAGIFPDFSTMAGQMVTDGQGGTIIRYSGSDTLTLQHILPTHLHAADFKFG